MACLQTLVNAQSCTRPHLVTLRWLDSLEPTHWTTLWTRCQNQTSLNWMEAVPASSLDLKRTQCMATKWLILMPSGLEMVAKTKSSNQTLTTSPLKSQLKIKMKKKKIMIWKCRICKKNWKSQIRLIPKWSKESMERKRKPQNKTLVRSTSFSSSTMTSFWAMLSISKA